MLTPPARRFPLANHIHGLPFDPPRWGEAPRLRAKAGLHQGRGVTAAVLDSGVSEHPWLAGSHAETPLPDEARELWDLSAAALPRHVGHGTFVAGVLLQYAPATRLLSRRVVDLHGDADDTRLAATIDALAAHDPDVVNLSLGPSPIDEPGEVDEGVRHTVAALRRLQDTCGTIVVVAAGNSGERFAAEHLVADDPLTVVVGALDLSGQPAWFSATESVRIWAPGVDVLSSFVHHDGPISLAHTGGDHDHGDHRHDAGHADHRHGDDHADQHGGGHGGGHGESGSHGSGHGEGGGHEHGGDGHHGGGGDGESEAPAEQRPIAPFAGWARWNGTSFAAPAVSGALCAEIGALTDVEDRRERRHQALCRALDAARPLPDGHLKGIVLSAWPVALQGPPLD